MTIRVGLDIDGVITADPACFAQLASSVLAEGGEVHVVTSRGEQARAETAEELRSYGLVYSCLHFIPPMSAADRLCPHAELGWYDRWLFGKVAYAVANGLTHFVDDDEKVALLFEKYARQIHCALPMGSIPFTISTKSAKPILFPHQEKWESKNL